MTLNNDKQAGFTSLDAAIARCDMTDDEDLIASEEVENQKMQLEIAQDKIVRLNEVLRTVFKQRVLTYNALGEAACNWCGRYDKNGLGEEYIEHYEECPFAILETV